MKKLLLPTVTVLLCALVIAVIPTEAEGAIYDDTVRLHIIASSDSEEDQALKLHVRDVILHEYGELLSPMENADRAAEEIERLLPLIEESAARAVAEWGYEYKVRATLGKENYGTRRYDGFTLPAGEYTSLRIVIGEGEGKNWWCVMYPPMCLGASVSSYSAQETRLIEGGEKKIKFKILELLSEGLK